MPVSPRLVLLLLVAASASAESIPLTLHRGGHADRVRVEVRLRYQGQITPEAIDAEDKPQPIPVSGDQTLAYHQEAFDEQAGTRRVVRVVDPVEGLRPGRLTLIAHEHPSGARVASAGEPLSRQELDRLQHTADPLDLGGLLPDREVREAGTWRVDQEAALRLLRLDEISHCELTGILTEFNGAHAKLRLAGPVKGRVDGAEIEINLRGVALYDRRTGQISRLNLGWEEKRSVGPTTPAVELTAKLNLSINRAGPIASDDLLLAAATQPDWRLEVTTQDGRWRLLVDRDWFAVAKSRQALTLRRLEKDRLAAMVTLVSAPGEGLTADALKREVRSSLGDELEQIVTARQDEAEGVQRRTVTSLGVRNGRPVAWRHDSLSAPGNGSLAATTTLSADENAEDRVAVGRLIESARPVAVETAAKPSATNRLAF